MQCKASRQAGRQAKNEGEAEKRGEELFYVTYECVDGCYVEVFAYGRHE